MEKEYVVVVNRGVDIEEFDAELAASTGSGPIPNRAVDIANPRPGSNRMTHWMLTDDEAEALKLDPRVLSVEIPADQRSDIKIGLRANQTGNFYRGTITENDAVNWGLRRSMATTNIYSNSTSVSGPYEYAIDGTGVDIVIQDSGIQPDHPEWNDAQGNSRFQQIDWYTASGLAGTQNANHYRDYDGHGTHCAGIAAGLTYGWAKGAHIYSQKLNGLEGTGDSGTGIPVADAFDAIRLWHAAKTNGRPTVVNMSWGYFTELSGTPSSGIYRGNPWTYGNVGYASATDIFGAVGIVPPLGLSRYFTASVASVNAEIEDMIDTGIHICIAAGNDFYKIDVSGGDDYDNSVTYDGPAITINYHRPSSPYSDRAFIVGNIDSTPWLDTTYKDKTAQSSNKGPAVNIWAPGTNIMSTASNFNNTFDYTQFDYPGNASYKIMSISGTSMAAPQVAGVCALHLQVTPSLTPAQLLSRVTADSTDVLYDTGSATDYSLVDRSIMGSSNRMLYSKYGRQPTIFRGSIS